MRTHRYIVFPEANSVREIILSCSIRPGPLSDSQYNVQWISRNPGEQEFTVVNMKDYDIKEQIDPSSHSQYQCIVTVQHRSDQDDTTVYNNTITIEQLSELHGGGGWGRDGGGGRSEGGLGHRGRREVSSSDPFVCSNPKHGLVSGNDYPHSHEKEKWKVGLTFRDTYMKKPYLVGPDKLSDPWTALFELISSHQQ